MVGSRFALLSLALLVVSFGISCDREQSKSGGKGMAISDVEKTAERLREHVKYLTVTIGERSLGVPQNLEKTATYIESFYRDLELPSQRKSYTYNDFTVASIVADIHLGATPTRHYLLGAHYDSVWGTVGADDNASAIAVQLETARELKSLLGGKNLGVGVKFVSFPLEEPPAFGTRYMASKIYAKRAKKENEQIDGMLCLEMVGYTCHQEGCQDYPFPLMFMDYPKEGNFIGIVGNLKSTGFTNCLYKAFQKNRDLPVVKLTVPLGGWLLPSVRLSDHASFWDQGYKAVMITDSAFYRNPHYHLPSDTMEKLDYKFMAQLVKSLVIFFYSMGSVR
jgi:Zn-dependent M28 family amino/carboxypeptidase